MNCANQGNGGIGRQRGDKLRLCFVSALDLDEGRLENAIAQYMQSV